jgi:twinkle protein
MDYSDNEKHALRAWALTKGQGHHRRTCFACSQDRKNKKASTLSVTIDNEKALWICFHCGAQGGLRLEVPAETRSFYAKPQPKKSSGAVKRIMAIIDPLGKLFLRDRGISEGTAKLFGVVTADAYFPDLKKETPAIAIPYILNERVSGHKVRSVEEKANVCDTSLSSLCGIQLVDLTESSDIVICEGEFDMLAMYEAGVLNATSVPNGSSSFTRGSEEGDVRTTMSFLWSAKEKIDKAKRIIVATDADEPGIKLAEELVRRIGKHRCWRVVFPADCKDANDVLLKHGGAALKSCMEHVEPWPVEGLYEAGMYSPDVTKLYEDGLGERVLTGMKPVDELYSCGPGLLTIITGIPGHGKSTFVDQLMVNMARKYESQFAICSFENPIPVHIAKLSEMLLQKHFFDDDKAGERMTKEELESTLPFINTHFKFLCQDDGKKATLDSIIERIKTAVFRWGIAGAVIDPYNYIARPKSLDSETQWIDDMLTQLRLVAQAYGIHLWLVAHPTKLMADSEGRYPPPRGYSISGSAAWYAKADFGLTVHRVPDAPGEVRIINWKTRFDWLGREGECKILYNTQTNTYLTDVLDDMYPYKPNASYRSIRDGDEEYIIQ